MRRLLAIAVLITIAGSAGAQQPVDFTGAWSTSPGGGARGGRGGAPPASMGSGWGDDITIVQKNGVLTVERVFFERGDLQPALKFRYALDGTPTTNTVMMGRGKQETTSTAAWDGDTLVVTSSATIPDVGGDTPAVSEVQRRLTLRPPAGLTGMPSLLIETTFGGVLGGPPTSTRTVYTRR
ncbi:MAG: hypothetical protein PVJ49_11855 [Acidobacteriota bacterium]|jgi:hypothetical protein